MIVNYSFELAFFFLQIFKYSDGETSLHEKYIFLISVFV